MKLHFFKPLQLQPQPLGEDENRLALSSGIIFLLLLMLIAPLYTRATYSAYLSKLTRIVLKQKMRPANSKIYPVIIEQKITAPKKTDQYRALSEFNAEGKGGITTEYGFHTLSNTDIFQSGTNTAGITGNTAIGANKPEPEQKKSTSGETTTSSDSNKSSSVAKQNGSPGMHLKVPANYRFKQHMALRYDGRSLTAIATESMPGAAYFRGMIRQIRDTFAPPGQNYILRDRYGYRLNQAIQPQIVSIQFVINRNGRVTDVKRLSSLGQSRVDQSCIEVLNNKNFGIPPPEIFRHGNVFGINFVFPDLRKYR